MPDKCPGSDTRFIKVEVHKCDKCGYEVEFFSDEVNTRCPKCKNTVYREKTPSCIDWCKHARECIGEERWRQIKNLMDEPVEDNREDYKDKVSIEMKKYFGKDIRRILHSEKVLAYTEEILKKEKGNRSVVIPAAILHDIGIKECEKKYNSTDGQLQEKEGPPIARQILEKLNILPETIDEVCKLIASHHSPGEIDSTNFKILWDADWLVNLRDEVDTKDKEKLTKLIEKIFTTQAGKDLAYKIYLGKE
ncbi:MAG: HD domain-containing protein [Candidatus Firestonebacteria bacterium]